MLVRSFESNPDISRVSISKSLASMSKSHDPPLLLLVSKYCLNSLGVSVSLHDLSIATGVHMSKIYLTQKPNENVKLDMSSLAEKFCCALKIDFKTTALIKERLTKPTESGHTPATVIAGSIYKIAKERKLKLSIKKISEVTSVSSISIQRYKNAFP